MTAAHQTTIRIAVGRIVIVAQPSSRGWLTVEAFEAHDAENLTPIVGFFPRRMKAGALLDGLGTLASEAEAALLKGRS